MHNRSHAMINASQIREHMNVVDASGKVIGKVDRVEGQRVKLTKDTSPDGQHHYVDLGEIEKVDGDKVCVRKSAH
jgi:hypothetical protein